MSTAKKNDDHLVLGPPARADLLPPEIKSEAKGRSQRRALIGIVILSVVLVFAAYAYAALNATIAKGRVDAANQRTAALLSEQTKFVEGKLVADQIEDIENAKILGVSTEIDWKAYMLEVGKSLPSGTDITAFSAETVEPGAVANAPDAPLSEENVAVINFTATTDSLPNVSEWIDNLADLKGFGDAVPGTIVFEDGLYVVNITMRINDEALAQRFVEVEEEASK